MAIKIFIIGLIFLGGLFTQIKIEEKKLSVKKQTTPDVVFYDSVMYELDQSNVLRTIQSKQMLHYNNKDELYDGTIVLRTQNGLADSISAEYILKDEEKYKFYQNVFAIRGIGDRLITDRLYYNNVKQIISNDTNFTLIKNESTLVGNNLYFDIIKDYFKADNTHFIIKDLNQ